jgi:N-acetylneuraminate synthase
MLKFKINNKTISEKNRTYFIADIAANHDGCLSRAKKLIRLAAKNGADAAKFQHFKAETIVNKKQFDMMPKLSHQSSWKESVFEVYKKASINKKWNKELLKECKKNKIDFMTAPYDLNYVDQLNNYICAYKIGSGDITWKEILVKISKKNKPVILATGASNFKEVKAAVETIKKFNKKIILMQCNTNYTGDLENFKHINLNVLKLYKKYFKDKIVLGLSDHTPGNTTVLGAIVLGARVIEKHFTDNNSRKGPDHKFSMNPIDWKKMVMETRNLENALGNGIKKIEMNEKKTSLIQRRGVYASRDIKKDEILKKNMTICLRPKLVNTISPFEIIKFLGKRLKKNINKYDGITKKCMI